MGRPDALGDAPAARLLSALVDTSVLTDYLRGHAGAAQLLERERAAGPLHASEMTRLEVLAGMRETEEAATRSLLSTLIWHPRRRGCRTSRRTRSALASESSGHRRRRPRHRRHRHQQRRPAAHARRPALPDVRGSAIAVLMTREWACLPNVRLVQWRVEDVAEREAVTGRLARAHAGERIEITRRGEVMAVLGPPPSGAGLAGLREAGRLKRATVTGPLPMPATARGRASETLAELRADER